MSEWHPYPGGTDARTGWEREQHRQTNQSLPLRGTSQYSVQRRTTGQSIKINSVAAARVKSGVYMMLVDYVQDIGAGDYLICRPKNGANDGSNDVYVAVPPELQTGLGAKVVGGVTIYTQRRPDGVGGFQVWTYSAWDETNQQRQADCPTAGPGSTPLTVIENITPPFMAAIAADDGSLSDGDIISVEPWGDTGVTVTPESGPAVKVKLLARTGRQWAAQT